MAIAAGRSAEEKRWVPLAEMAGELCAMSGSDECEADVVDGQTGARRRNPNPNPDPSPGPSPDPNPNPDSSQP